MDEIRLNKKIDGIAEVRDESDRTGLQIVVELKRCQCSRNFELFVQKH